MPCAAASITTGGCAQVPCPLQRRHQDRLSAVGLLAAVEEVEGLDDPPAALVVFERDRLAVEVRRRIGRGVRPVGDGHPAEVLTGHPELVHDPGGEHGDPRRRGEQPVGRGPRVLHLLRRGTGGPVLHAGTEAAARALVEGSVAEDVVGDALGHRHRRVLHGGARRAPAEVDAAEVGELADAETAHHVVLRVALHGEGRQPVDLLGCDAGVVERGDARLEGQAQLAAPRALGELGGPDADDGGRPGEAVAGHGRHASRLTAPSRVRR